MPLYENRKYCENRIKLSQDNLRALRTGPEQTIAALLDAALARADGKTAIIGCDSWYGIDWPAVVGCFRAQASQRGVEIECLDMVERFVDPAAIAAYKAPFIGEDPAFGVVNTNGVIADLLDQDKVKKLAATLADAAKKSGKKVVVVYGCGALVEPLAAHCHIKAYFDKTRQPILWEMWDGKLIPFGQTDAKADYNWKEYYYCDYYLLERQKDKVLKQMDFWVEGIKFESLKLMTRTAYDEMMAILIRMPIKEVTIFQPGPWGAYRYKDLWFDVPGLECNAWNELAGPELSILVDVGDGNMVNLPMTNLMAFDNDKFLGAYINETYPGLFPLDIWLDDGYFPKPEPAERISMPMHNHPSTQYVQEHFKEPLGRYETYYIAEAYEGANTWLSYKDDADIEEWERLCRESNNLKEIPNWKDYIKQWDSNVGDLYLIPPGTCHGHGGNQMVLEMDTCPSVAATEYSFFIYDFARNSWDDKKKEMSGPPLKMHLDHGFDNERWVRESWAENRLRAKPVVIKFTPEYMIDRYTSDPRMPFEVERLHFEKRAEYNTDNRFLHILTLTVGSKVRIQSKSDPSRCTEIHKWQSAIVPCCMDEYEIVNLDGGQCTVVLLRWKKG
ncbi:MAG: hypothetical protein LIP23_05850 [Planctomycetes bacterium]|nr:hypothetical protein [Planctomycetota bacterium]